MNETALQIKRGSVLEGYKKTEAGIIPVDWACAKLCEIADPITKTAGTDKYETLSISAGIGFVNQAEKFGKELSGKQYEKYIVLQKGDFSYNKGNSGKYPQGCIYRLMDRETAAVPNVFESFRLKGGYCPEFYDFLFRSGFMNKQLARKINHGVRDDGLLNLTDDDFYSTVLPVPSLAEQQKIAKILSTCDRLIERKQKLVEELQQLKKTCLAKMFPCKGADVPELRFPGFTDPWEQRKLGDLVESIKNGYNYKADGCRDYQYKITRIESISSGEINKDKLGSSETINETYRLEDGDILFSHINSLQYIANTAIYTSDLGEIYHGMNLLNIRAKHNDIDAHFLLYLLKMETSRNWFRMVAKPAVNQASISITEVASFEFCMPNIEEQKKSLSS